MGPSGAERGKRHDLPEREILEVLDLRPGMTVAELNSGGSGLALKISEFVGPAGQVYAVDERISPGVGEQRNVDLIQAPVHATKLPAGCCDRIVMVNSWTSLPDAAAALREAARLLRDNGRLIVVERHANSVNDAPGSNAAAFDELVCMLEKNSWDIHRHGATGASWYFLEASVSDESVQS